MAAIFLLDSNIINLKDVPPLMYTTKNINHTSDYILSNYL